jgi:hypothetical protein
LLLVGRDGRRCFAIRLPKGREFVFESGLT